jgi:hypothetical protein
MSMLSTRRIAVAAGMAIASAIGPVSLLSAQTPLGAAFTYQGRLTDGANPANGPYDMEFWLYDAATSGNPILMPVFRVNVPVAGGIFTVPLDFTANAFDGNARWLEVRVRPGGTSGVLTTITPRHELTAAPYALYALDTLRFGGSTPSAYATKVYVQAGLSSIPASNLTGTLSDALLSSNVPRLPANQTFTGTNVFAGGLTIGTITAACAAGNAGSVRYNGGTAKLEFCNGSSWADIATKPAWMYTSAFVGQAGCWGGNASTFVDSGATFGAPPSGAPFLISLYVAGTTNLESLSGSMTFRLVDNNGTELGRKTVNYAPSESKALDFTFPYGGTVFSPLKLQCASTATNMVISAGEVRLLIAGLP